MCELFINGVPMLFSSKTRVSSVISVNWFRPLYKS